MADGTNNNKQNILDILGALLLFISAVSLVLVFLFWFCVKSENAKPSEITLIVQPDSTGALDAASRQAIDSLTTLMKQQDTFVRERYSLLVEQRKQENGLMTFAGVIVSIILGIFGFFGYKSFKSIEDKAVTNADDKVKKKVNTEMVTMQKTLENELTGTIDKRFVEEYKLRLGEEVGKQLEEKYNTTISARISFIQDQSFAFEDLANRVSLIEQFISQLQDNGVDVRLEAPKRLQNDLEEFTKERKKSRGKQSSEKEKGGKL